MQHELVAQLDTVVEPALAFGMLRSVRQSARRERDWDGLVENMERLAATPGFCDLRDRIIERAQLQTLDVVLDVGAGTGLLTLAAAPRVAHVYALDISREMCRRLAGKVADNGIANIAVLRGSATELPLADGAVDVVLSNYCFHHLRDAEKERALGEILRVLRPGGRLVFADMMFSLSLVSRRDRDVVLRVVRRMLLRGPAGVLRIARNALRAATGRGEHPARIDWWHEVLGAVGFTHISVEALNHEGGIASALRPWPREPARKTSPSSHCVQSAGHKGLCRWLGR